MLGLVPIRLGGGPRLAQLTASPFTVVVSDPRGTPFKGVQVTIQGQAMPQTTDENGRATFPSVPVGQVIANVQVGDLRMPAAGNSDSTLFVTMPICADGPILTKTELLAILVGGGLAGAGFYWKQGPLKMVGEVILGAAVFTAIYRSSCRW